MSAMLVIYPARCPDQSGQAHAAVSPFDLIREALGQPVTLDDRMCECPQCRDTARKLAALDQLQRDHEALTEWVDRNAALQAEMAAATDAAVREAETLRKALTQIKELPSERHLLLLPAVRAQYEIARAALASSRDTTETT